MSLTHRKFHFTILQHAEAFTFQAVKYFILILMPVARHHFVGGDAVDICNNRNLTPRMGGRPAKRRLLGTSLLPIWAGI